MAAIKVSLDSSKIQGINISKRGEYNYANVTTAEDDMYISFSVEWKDGADIPDAVMDLIDLTRPTTKKEKSSVEITDETKAFFARLGEEYARKSDGK